MIFPTAYLPPILQYAYYLQAEAVMFEAEEHFNKQTYRNRCYIYGANGKLMLSVPLEKWANHTATKDIRIAYHHPWQDLHWRSFESAYRTSPYFEYYEEYFRPFYEKKQFDFLMDWNEALEETIDGLLKIAIDKKRTTVFQAIEDGNDLRIAINPKNKTLEEGIDFPSYPQVFEEKAGFIANLSIFDLLCNEGPAAKSYLEALNLKR